MCDLREGLKPLQIEIEMTEIRDVWLITLGKVTSFKKHIIPYEITVPQLIRHISGEFDEMCPPTPPDEEAD